MSSSPSSSPQTVERLGVAKRLAPPRVRLLVGGLALLVVLLGARSWLTSQYREERRAELRADLTAVLRNARAAVRSWSATERSRAARWTEVPRFKSAVEQQLALAHDTERLRASAALEELRSLLSADVSGSGIESSAADTFFIVSREGVFIAASNDDWIGRRLPRTLSWMIDGSLDGRARLGPLPDSVFDPVSDNPSPSAGVGLLLAAPVRDAGGDVVAALGFGLDADRSLRPLIGEGKFGGGFIGLYSESGQWLTSGPADHLSVGADQGDATYYAARSAAAPAGSAPASDPPISIELHGHRGRFGRRVVGGWTFSPESGLGAAAEWEYDEAFSAVLQLEEFAYALCAFGVLLVIGIVLVTRYGLAGDRRFRFITQTRNFAAWGILTVSLIATAVLWKTTQSRVEVHDRERFAEAVARSAGGVQARLARYGESLHSISAAFAAFDQLDGAKWSRFVASLELDLALPEISHVSFVQRVPRRRLRDFAREFRADNNPGYQPPSSPLDDYWPIRHIEPLEANRQRLGRNFASAPALRAAAERARDSGTMALSPPLDEPLLSAGASGLVILFPVYEGGRDPGGLRNRRQALRGWVSAFLNTQEMMRSLTPPEQDAIELEIFDGDQLVAATATADELGDPPGQQRARIESNAGGRRWTLAFRSTENFASSIWSDQPAQVLLGGLVISVLLFDIALVLASTRSSALAMAELMTRRVRESEARIRAVIQQAPDGIITFDERGIIGTFNPGAEKLFGYPAEQVIGSEIDLLMPSCFERKPPAEGSAAAETGPAAPAGKISGNAVGAREAQGKRRSGEIFPIELTVGEIELDGRRMFTAIVRDVSDRKQAEEALRESEERYALAARAANDGLWDWNLKTNRIYYSSRWKAMLGFSEQDVGDSPDEWLQKVHPEDRAVLLSKLSDHLAGLTAQLEVECRAMHRDGTYRWMLICGIAVRDDSGKSTRIAGSQTDITGRKRAEKKLLHEALHDSLTGLPNRSYFMGRLERATLKATGRRNPLFALLFLDMDRFKVINDSLGHVVGDELLIAVSDRLKTCVRPGDTIARLGGDEFAILLENLSDQAQATRIADRIQKELSAPVRVGDQEVFTAVSIGIAFSQSGKEKPSELLRNADTAMYRAKARGRARYATFDEGMQIHAVELLQLETALHKAVDRKEFLIRYEPILSTQGGEIIRCEAVIFWNHPKNGAVPFAEFAQTADEAGLSASICEWALREACLQVGRWRKQGLPPIGVAVNIAAAQLRDGELVRKVAEALADNGLDPSLLQLEMRESALLDTTDETMQPLIELSSKGVRICLDDCRSGYSSLAYLRRHPISTVKINAALLYQVESDLGDPALASGMIGLAHNLEIEVVVDGVETPEQLFFLRSSQCDAVQGSLISPPLTAEACTKVLAGGLEASLLLKDIAEA